VPGAGLDGDLPPTEQGAGPYAPFNCDLPKLELEHCFQQHQFSFNVSECHTIDSGTPSFTIQHSTACEPNVASSYLENNICIQADTNLPVALAIYAQDFCDTVIDTVDLSGDIFAVSAASYEAMIQQNKQWTQAEILNSTNGYLQNEFVWGIGGVEVCFLLRVQGDSTSGGGEAIVDIESITLDPGENTEVTRILQVPLGGPTPLSNTTLDYIAPAPAPAASNILVACYIEDASELGNESQALVEVEAQFYAIITYVQLNRRRVMSKTFDVLGNVRLPPNMMKHSSLAADAAPNPPDLRRMMLQTASGTTTYSELILAKRMELVMTNPNFVGPGEVPEVTEAADAGAGEGEDEPEITTGEYATYAGGALLAIAMAGGAFFFCVYKKKREGGNKGQRLKDEFPSQEVTEMQSRPIVKKTNDTFQDGDGDDDDYLDDDA